MTATIVFDVNETLLDLRALDASLSVDRVRKFKPARWTRGRRLSTSIWKRSLPV